MIWMSRASKKIAWRNIYHMIAYAIDELAYMDLDDIDFEEYKSLNDLIAELMIKAVELLNENAYLHDYNKTKIDTDKIKGRILIEDSYRRGVIALGKLCCEYFKFDVNSIYNKIIKTALKHILTRDDIADERLIKINSIINEMYGIDTLEPYNIDFRDIDYKSLPGWYKPAIVVSKLVIDEIIGLDEEGNRRLYELSDNTRLRYIFEKFVRNFYMNEYKRGRTTNPSIPIRGSSRKRKRILDALIETDTRALIINAKWYDSEKSYTSRNENMAVMLDCCIGYSQLEGKGNVEVAGVVLYAKNNSDKCDFDDKEERKVGVDIEGESHNKVFMIYDKTIDLCKDFEDIKRDLIKKADAMLFQYKY